MEREKVNTLPTLLPAMTLSTAALLLAFAVVSTLASSSSSSSSSHRRRPRPRHRTSRSRIVEATLNVRLAYKDVDGKGARGMVEINGGFPGPVVRKTKKKKKKNFKIFLF
jgi:hypothetical protein